MEGMKVILLQEIGAYLRTLSVPFAVVGDFNLTVEELAPLQFEILLEARWVIPRGDVPGTLRRIDLALVSDSLLAGYSMEWDLQWPWTPHTGFVLTLDVHALAMQTRRLEAPTGIQLAHGPDRPWDHYKTIGEQHFSRQGQEVGEERRQLDREYGVFAVAAEQLLLERQGAEPSPAMRRGWQQQEKLEEVKRARPAGWMEKPTGITHWKALRSRLINLRGNIRQGTSNGNRARLRGIIIGTLLTKIDKIPRILPNQQEERDFLHRIYALDLDTDFKDLVEDLRKFINKLEAYLLQQGRDRFRDWVKPSLRMGAGALHKFTKSYGELRTQLAPVKDERGQEVVEALRIVDAKAAQP